MEEFDFDKEQLWKLSEEGNLKELIKKINNTKIERTVFSKSDLNYSFFIDNCNYNKALSILKDAKKISVLEKNLGFEENLEDFLNNVNVNLKLAKDYFQTRCYEEGLSLLSEARQRVIKSKNKNLLNDFDETVDDFVKESIIEHLDSGYFFAEEIDDSRTMLEMAYANQLKDYLRGEEKEDFKNNINRVSNICYQWKASFHLEEVSNEVKKETPDHGIINNSYAMFNYCRRELDSYMSNKKDVIFINKIDRKMQDIMFDLRERSY